MVAVFQWELRAACFAGVHIGKVLIDTTASPQPYTTENCIGAATLAAPAKQLTTQLPPLMLEPALHFRYNL